MNVESFTQFRLSFTAALTSVLVAASCVAALAGPVGAVIGFDTALPVRVVLSAESYLLVLAAAFLATEAPPPLCNLALCGDKLFTAMLAHARQARIGWVVWANFVLGVPLAKALHRAEAPFRVERPLDVNTAIFAVYWGEFYDTKLAMNVGLRGALARAINSRPALVIGEILSTLRALCSYSLVGSSTSAGAVLFSFPVKCAGIVDKLLITGRASCGYGFAHGV